MKIYRDGRVQDRILNRIERQEKKRALERERFLRFKLQEVHSKLYQKLLVDEVIETDDPAAISDSLLNGLKKALKSTDFDFNYTKPINLPEYYIINKKVVVLNWENGEKTVIKLSEGDEFNARLGFLIAYFQHTSGLTKSKANKYLDSLVETPVPTKKKKELAAPKDPFDDFLESDDMPF